MINCTGRWAPRHLPTVVFTRRVKDLFRRRYWVRCWECDLRFGPFVQLTSARSAEVEMDK